MLPDLQRTIVALASGAHGAQRAVVRLAGPESGRIVQSLCTSSPGFCNLPSDFHRAQRLTWYPGQAYLPGLQKSLPLTLIYWPDDRSYTGSPAAELHFIGSLPLAHAVIDRCCQLGAHIAQRGEFTLRAFLAGKLDLAQAEAVLGVIQADSSDTLATALAQLGGNLAPAVTPLRDTILGVLAELEAGLDFVDEDIQFLAPEDLLAQLHQVAGQVQQFARRLNTRSSSDLVPQVVLAGLPNSGKSSLFNALAQRELAIVADVPGTTRDYLQHRLQVGSVSFDLIDTAGWELLQDHSPRALAQDKLADCLHRADVVILCADLSTVATDSGYVEQLQEKAGDHARWLVVGTKSDQATRDGTAALQELVQRCRSTGVQPILTSHQSSDSIEQLRSALAQAVAAGREHAISDSLTLVHETAVRCRASLEASMDALEAAMELVRNSAGDELVAAELRLVADELATIIGQVHSDDVLGEIFSRFCIGK